MWFIPEAVDMNGRFQMQGGKNWFLPKEMNANLFFWDSHWLEIWSNHFYPSMGPNGGSVAMDSERRHGFTYCRVPGHAFLVCTELMTDGCVHLQCNSCWKFHQLATGQLLSGQPWYGMEKTGRTARPSHAKSHLPGNSPPTNKAGRCVGSAL